LGTRNLGKGVRGPLKELTLGSPKVYLEGIKGIIIRNFRRRRTQRDPPGLIFG